MPFDSNHPCAPIQGNPSPAWKRKTRSHSLVADFGAIVHRREPDNPVKDGALSRPFFSLQMGTLEKASTENGKEVGARL
jgi:hypothetical protein